MRLYPAIDLLKGQAVRLLRGDYGRATVYYPDPLDAALLFEQAGATHLHLVDLEGALEGRLSQRAAIRRILRHTGLIAEVGGGIRDMAAVEEALSLGAHQVILGTAALSDPGFLQRALETYGDRIVVGADAREGYVAVNGWKETSAVTLEDFLQDLSAMGVARVVLTDIARDGAMQGASHALYRRILASCPLRITASGGVSTAEDIRALRRMGVEGAVVGRALYTGGLTLAEALAAAREE